MSAAAEPQLQYRPQTARRLLFAALFTAVSIVAHVAGFTVMDVWSKRDPPKQKQKPMELVMIEVKPPPPPPPEVKEEPPPPPPPPKVKVKPPPVKIAKVDPPKELPKEQLPPPPNQEPPPDAKPNQPIKVGISMESTSTAGTFNAPVGNTQYGKTEDVAPKPEEVKPYAAPKYMPSYQVDSQPELMSEVRGEYPAEAARAGIEGSVILKITIDVNGDVTEAKLLQGLGYGLDEVALKSIRRFKFKAATKAGEKVGTTITYKYTFWLE